MIGETISPGNILNAAVTRAATTVRIGHYISILRCTVAVHQGTVAQCGHLRQIVNNVQLEKAREQGSGITGCVKESQNMLLC